jgi:hypothetical protein
MHDIFGPTEMNQHIYAAKRGMHFGQRKAAAPEPVELAAAFASRVSDFADHAALPAS